ncbi:hypothetical protein D3C72_1510290 [compost metagenome]
MRRVVLAVVGVGLFLQRAIGDQPHRHGQGLAGGDGGLIDLAGKLQLGSADQKAGRAVDGARPDLDLGPLDQRRAKDRCGDVILGKQSEVGTRRLIARTVRDAGDRRQQAVGWMLAVVCLWSCADPRPSVVDGDAAVGPTDRAIGRCDPDQDASDGDGLSPLGNEGGFHGGSIQKGPPKRACSSSVQGDGEEAAPEGLHPPVRAAGGCQCRSHTG